MTVKSIGLTPVPTALIALMGPVVAPTGTVATISVSKFAAKLEGVPLKATSVTPAKLTPVIATEVPAGPLVGAKSVIMGGSVASMAE